MTDHLAVLKPAELAKFYGRIADGVDANRGSLKVSLAALLMRQWLRNRDPKSLFEFDAPEHLKDRTEVLDTLAFQRRVLLTQEKARFTGGIFSKAARRERAAMTSRRSMSPRPTSRSASSLPVPTDIFSPSRRRAEEDAPVALIYFGFGMNGIVSTHWVRH